MTCQTRSRTRSKFRGAALCAALCLFGHGILAETVTLRSPSGGLEIEGRYLGHDGDHIRIETEAGRLTFNLAAVTCEGDACPTEDTPPLVRFSGTVRLGEIVLPALVDGFAREAALTVIREETSRGSRYTFADDQGRDLAVFSFDATTTADGLADLLADEADILMSYRLLHAAEVEMARQAGLGDLGDPRQVHLLGLDAVIPVVSPRLGMSTLSLAQVAEALSGEVSNWAELGGPDLAIAVHMPNREHAVTGHVERQVLSATGGDFTETATFHPGLRETAEAIAADRGALGVLPVADVGNTLAVSLRDSCGRAAVPTAPNVATADYPLTTAVVLYEARRIFPPLYQDFLAWLTRPEAQIILRRLAIETDAPNPIAVRQQGDRLAAAVLAAGEDVSLTDLQTAMRAFEGRVRLSPTFRFDPASPRLDGLSQLEIEALARRISEGAFDGRSLVLIGFSDGAGNASDNLTLSRERANAVEAALVAALGGVWPEDVDAFTQGLGEAIPIACDDTPWGRHANRRVELWVDALE